jgi:hypothetical protein
MAPCINADSQKPRIRTQIPRQMVSGPCVRIHGTMHQCRFPDATDTHTDSRAHGFRTLRAYPWHHASMPIPRCHGCAHRFQGPWFQGLGCVSMAPCINADSQKPRIRTLIPGPMVSGPRVRIHGTMHQCRFPETTDTHTDSRAHGFRALRAYPWHQGVGRMTK